MFTFSLRALQQRLREQLDHEAPAPVMPLQPGFDLYDPDDEEAARLLRQRQRRDSAAALILVGAVHTLQLIGFEEEASLITGMLAVCRAEWWITEAETPEPKAAA